MRGPSLENNCYRAILAQVNYLDSIYQQRHRVKDLYEELTELAFYMMVDDNKQVIKGIDQMKDTVCELEQTNTCQPDDTVPFVLGELKTHLDFLRMEYTNKFKNIV